MAINTGIVCPKCGGKKTARAEICSPCRLSAVSPAGRKKAPTKIRQDKAATDEQLRYYGLDKPERKKCAFCFALGWWEGYYCPTHQYVADENRGNLPEED